MPAPTPLQQLLLDVGHGTVAHESYSRMSLYGRCEPIMLTTVLAAIAIWSGMLLGGAVEPRR